MTMRPSSGWMYSALRRTTSSASISSCNSRNRDSRRLVVSRSTRKRLAARLLATVMFSAIAVTRASAASSDNLELCWVMLCVTARGELAIFCSRIDKVARFPCSSV